MKMHSTDFLRRAEGFKPGESTVYKAGHVGRGWDDLPARPLTSDIRVDHDVELIVRDGAKLYADIYRPEGSTEKVPIIISWSAYGKKYNGLSMLPVCTWKCGVVSSDISGLEKFEGLGECKPRLAESVGSCTEFVNCRPCLLVSSGIRYRQRRLQGSWSL